MSCLESHITITKHVRGMFFTGEPVNVGLTLLYADNIFVYYDVFSFINTAQEVKTCTRSCLGCIVLRKTLCIKNNFLQWLSQ
jgi:hypothetical protein